MISAANQLVSANSRRSLRSRRLRETPCSLASSRGGGLPRAGASAALLGYHQAAPAGAPEAAASAARWTNRRDQGEPIAPANLTSYWNERKAHETGVVPILSGYTLGFWRGREERCQAQFL